MIKSTGVAAEKKVSGSDAVAGRRGPDIARRTAILDCADAVFLDMGFQAASMSAIAAKLGGSKGTLYNYFESKEELFLACVSRHCEELQSQLSMVSAEGGAFRETLGRIGRRYVEVVSSDDVVRKFRMIVAEAERAPELAQAFYANGPANAIALLAAFLDRAMDRGELRRNDPTQAAQHFLGLCNSTLWKARLCAVAAEPSANEIAKNVEAAVSVFMAFYGPPSAVIGESNS